jgi:alpha-tubulin suppressor-like RCC1 family protein
MRRRRLEDKSLVPVTPARQGKGKVHKLLRLVSVGVVLTLTLTGLAVLGSTSASQASVRPVNPTVSSFTVTPSSLNAPGGPITLSAQVANATSCVFSSNRVVPGLPATSPCSNGTVTDEVIVPANLRKRADRYSFHLSVTGAKTVKARPIELTVAAVGGAPTPIAISAGVGDTCDLLATGIADCWGFNNYGELGNGTYEYSAPALPVSGLSGATAIAAGGYSTCAVLAGGTVDCWGYNFDGELGDGTTSGPQICPVNQEDIPCSTTPVAVSGLSGATAVSGGPCALLIGGTVDCWGDNSNGQLGDGTTTDSSTPVAVSGLSGVTAIASGNGQNCALLTGGTVDCRGWNFTGELGNGTTTDSSTPVAVSGLTGVTAIGAGDSHTCAVLTGGTVDCWGDNSNGQLGDGTTTVSSTPVSVSGLTGVTAVTGGFNYTCALLTGGTVDCWGSNDNGQLGDGTTTDSSTPVAVSGLSGVTAIASGFSHTCAILTGGAVDCWGSDI